MLGERMFYILPHSIISCLYDLLPSKAKESHGSDVRAKAQWQITCFDIKNPLFSLCFKFIKCFN